MYRFLALFLVALSVSAQSGPARNQVLDKAPQDIDDALRARIKQFYDLHVAKKYRQAEALIAEDSKDDWYSLSKPDLHGYKIGNIEYSDDYTKAKVVIIGALPVLLAWAGGRIMDMPFASYWRIENGQWCWYYNKEALKHTPFGDVKTVSNSDASQPTAMPVIPKLSLTELQSALKIDRTHIDLSPSQPQTLKVTNTLPGPASLEVACPNMPLDQTGITATFDKKNLKGGETATLTLTASHDSKTGNLPLQIIISPTNQVLSLTVSVSR